MLAAGTQLALAQREGTIQLVLRGYGDPDSVKTTGAIKGDLLSNSQRSAPVRTAPAVPRSAPARPRTAAAPASAPVPVLSPPPAAPAPRPDSVVVRVYRGEQQSTVKFEQNRDSVRRARPDTLLDRRPE